MKTTSKVVYLLIWTSFWAFDVNSQEKMQSQLTQFVPVDSKFSKNYLSGLEAVYHNASTDQEKAKALCVWENALIDAIRNEHWPDNTVALTSIQPDENARQISFTIIGFPSFESYNYASTSSYLFKAQLESSCDKMEIQGFPGIYGIGDGSIIRFKGVVPFPVKTEDFNKQTAPFGWESHGLVEYGNNPPGSSITFITQGPQTWYEIFYGDYADPLTYAMIKGVGFVYLHGKDTNRFKQQKSNQPDTSRSSNEFKESIQTSSDITTNSKVENTLIKWIEQNRKLRFEALPDSCEIRIFKLSGEGPLVWLKHYSLNVHYYDCDLPPEIVNASDSKIYIYM